MPFPSETLYPGETLYPSDTIVLPEPPGDESSLWERLYHSLGFHVEDDRSEDLRRFCEALSTPAEPVFDIVTKGGVPWEEILDPTTCPAYALPYLAQYVGVVITPEMSEQQIRDEITSPTGWRRGQPETIRTAVRRTLVPAVPGEELFVILKSRTPEVGRHYVRTLLSQTPDPARTERIARAALPAWEVMDYEAVVGTTYVDLEAGWATYEALDAEFEGKTYKELDELLPVDLPE